MDFLKEKLLTVITEADIEEHFLQDIEELGAKGYTITTARGKGERGLRSADWNLNSNIKIEILCSAKTCDIIVKFLKENYLRNYAMTLFVSDVEVLS